MITWHEIINVLNEWHLKGQYFNPSGTPVGSSFTIASPSGNKVPLGGVMLYDGNDFVIGLNEIVVEFSGSEIVFTDGDVYGIFIPNSVNDVNDNNPDKFGEYELFQNYPNPFNPTTSIEYRVSGNEFVTLKVYDILGNEIAALVNEEKPAGTNEVDFNASGLASGIYYYTITTGNFRESKKMILMK